MRGSLIIIKTKIHNFLHLHLDQFEATKRMNTPQINLSLLMVGEVIKELNNHKVPAFLTIWCMVKNLKTLKFGVFAKHTRAEKIYIKLLPCFTNLYNRLNNQALEKMTAGEFIDILTRLEAEINTAIATLGLEKIVSDCGNPNPIIFETRNIDNHADSFDTQSILIKNSFNIASATSTSSISLDYHALSPMQQESSAAKNSRSVTWHPEVEDNIKVSNHKKRRLCCF